MLIIVRIGRQVIRKRELIKLSTFDIKKKRDH